MHQHGPDTQVLIVGNGPAGLSLSAFLSGVLPFYNSDSPHPDPLVHHKLSERLNESLIDQDLSWCDSRDELGNFSRPLSVLYDSLVRPGADLGGQLPSSLQWETIPHREIPHIVLGETSVGGSWNNYDEQMLAVSFSSWLDLPGYSISQCLGGTPIIPRLPSVAIASYMECYAKQLALRRNIRPQMKVTSITKQGEFWLTEGTHKDGRKFSITSRQVVLACGKTKSRTLGLENEDLCNKIVYDLQTMKARINQRFMVSQNYTSDCSRHRIIIVGDGISSADAVRYCLENELPVLHIIRRTDGQLRNILMSRLSPSYYVEYHSIYRLMVGRDTHSLYQRCTASNIIRIENDGIIIQTPKGDIEEPLYLLVVCIGRESDFNGILPGKHSFLGYRSEEDPTLFCAGSFAGDHFVRYIVGGCLEVARSIHAIYREINNNIK